MLLRKLGDARIISKQIQKLPELLFERRIEFCSLLPIIIFSILGKIIFNLKIAQYHLYFKDATEA